MRACVVELLFDLFVVLRGAGVGGFGKDRDWGTYPEVSTSYLANRPES